MKKFVLLLSILLTISLQLLAQLYTPSGTITGSSGNTNVGIGTASSGGKLEINQAGGQLKLSDGTLGTIKTICNEK